VQVRSDTSYALSSAHQVAILMGTALLPQRDARRDGDPASVGERVGGNSTHASIVAENDGFVDEYLRNIFADVSLLARYVQT